jgi:methyltransferase (TIGR00027 family)
VKIKGDLPSNVAFLAADLEQRDIASVLGDSTFDKPRPAFFLLEGLLHYLDEAAVDGTLRSIGDVCAPGSRLAFTYIHRGRLDGLVQFGNMGRVPATLSRSGETWSFGLYPKDVSAYLAERGFVLMSDMGSVDYRALYIGTSGRLLEGFEFYRAAIASKACE